MSNNQSTTIFMGDGSNGGTSPEDPNKKKRKRLLIILLVFLGVVGLGVTGYYLFFPNGGQIRIGEGGSGDVKETPDSVYSKESGDPRYGGGDDTTSKDKETEEQGPSEEETPSTETIEAEEPKEESPYDALTEDAIAFPESTVKSEDPILLSNNKNLELEYDFGDGERKNGVRVEHAYKDLGPKTIRAYVPGTDKLIGEKDIVVHCSRSTAEGAFDKLINIARNPSNDPDGNKWDAAVDELGRLCDSPQTLVILELEGTPCKGGCPFTQFKSKSRAIRAAMRRKGGQPRITQMLNTESKTGKITRIVIEIG